MHGEAKIEVGVTAVVYVPVMLKPRLLDLLNEVSRWCQ